MISSLSAARTRTSRLLIFTQPLYHDELENPRREAGTRTPSAWSRTRRADPYATSRRPDELSGPPRIRTGKPSPCKGVALPIGASSPGAARPGTTGSQGRPHGRGRAREWSLPRSFWCSAVKLSIHRHVHPAGWCSAWTAGIEPATTGFGDQRSPKLSYVHRSYANENRPPGVSPASGFRSVLTPLSRSHSCDQGSIGQQARGHANMPLVLSAPVA
jgi:hypothetical protein